ncbi:MULTISPECIES: NfeD family protein [Mesorhizobium]|uniref:NfeD family protein n=1 Tax=Mesorhizobium denitrificans TaxID=2294114 RepID=A0A371XDW6_9HYPH|nr:MULTISPECIES: NfeD family protein [Mesorhizobium]RFC67429.1 NfeD family protein [Mesorhizobium denitrificans]
MLSSIVEELGPWNWTVFGVILLTLEIFAPGVFLLWIGIAALIVGAISLALWDAAFWTWHVQMLLFLALSLISAYVGKRIMASRSEQSDQPLLNRRGDQLIGRVATLIEPIENGRGRVKLGDTMWRVAGPDLPAGARVRVVKASDIDLELIVEAA